jgi:hypothetical protein
MSGGRRIILGFHRLTAALIFHWNPIAAEQIGTGMRAAR